MRPLVALAAITVGACSARQGGPRAEHLESPVCPHDAVVRGGVCLCAPGLSVLEGACVGPREHDAYVGLHHLIPACAPDDAIDLATGACLPPQQVRDLVAHVRPVPDDLKLACREGRALAVEGDDVSCLASSDVCPRGSDWDAKHARCAGVPACEPGEVRAEAGACVRVVTRERDGRPVLDVGRWLGAMLGADGGDGTARLCRPLSQQAAELDVGPGGARTLALTIELVFPDNDVTQLSGRVAAQPAGAASADAARKALDPLLVPLRALGGVSDAASATLRVRCTIEGGSAVVHPPVTPGPDLRDRMPYRKPSPSRYFHVEEPVLGDKPRYETGLTDGRFPPGVARQSRDLRRCSEAYVDSDMADAVEGLKAIFAKRKIASSFGKSSAEVVEGLKKQLRIPSRFRAFLLAANPVRVETVTPVERIRLIPAEELVKAQTVVTHPPEGGPAPLDWKPAWVIIGESALLGDPYFLDTSKPDPEGDCPVYTAMSGQERWVPTLAASSFAQFLRILSTAMEIAAGFGDAIMDDEDEDSFREALGPKVKIIDAAAMRAGHWT